MQYIIQLHTRLGQVPIFVLDEEGSTGSLQGIAHNRCKAMQAFIDEHPEMGDLFGIGNVDYVGMPDR